ncbi:MAG: hypothetical protein CVU40_03875 [Chloroflexi bacterium HGW-Chloroflexi-2]|jgi:hypothetical protein|nr:MAG: hypothetical protein CVU40_03875 [Chloroflexi bacterium HGW-Chloroflexi-2]
MITQFEEKGKIFTPKITKDQREVIIQTTTQKIRGFFHVQMDLRLLDELNESNHFLALTDVEILDVNENVIYKSNFLAINTDQIIWVLPSDEIIEK